MVGCGNISLHTLLCLLHGEVTNVGDGVGVAVSVSVSVAVHVSTESFIQIELPVLLHSSHSCVAHFEMKGLRRKYCCL